MYQALYRKWRPQTFDDVIGQQHITDSLKNQVLTGRLSHAYLFTGIRGTGKTSCARILAKAVNCEHPKDGNPCCECASCRAIAEGSVMDIVELDAASNNGVDNVRSLREETVFSPATVKKRVYIIDEVHMLTDSAFNALLKTLEEPPEYVVFVLATTELNELPPTIISRCIRFDFSRIDPESVKARVDFVAGQEGIKIEDSAAALISELADGSMRDGLSLLEAVSNGTDGIITREVVQGVLGIAGDETVYAMLHAIAAGNVPAAVSTIAEVHKSSKDISVFIDDLSVVVRDLIIEKQLGKYGGRGELRKVFLPLAEEFTAEKLFYVSGLLEETQSRISRYAMNKRVIFELAVIRMCDPSLSDSPKALSARIADLEKKIAIMSVMGVETSAPPVIEEPEKPAEEAEKKEPQFIKEPVTEEEQVPFDKLEEINEFLNNAPSICAFLGSTDIMLQGSKVIITGDRFTIDMISMDNDFPALTAAFSSVLGRKAEVVLVPSDKKTEDNAQQSLLDELI